MNGYMDDGRKHTIVSDDSSERGCSTAQAYMSNVAKNVANALDFATKNRYTLTRSATVWKNIGVDVVQYRIRVSIDVLCLREMISVNRPRGEH